MMAWSAIQQQQQQQSIRHQVVPSEFIYENIFKNGNNYYYLVAQYEIYLEIGTNIFEYLAMFDSQLLVKIDLYGSSSNGRC